MTVFKELMNIFGCGADKNRQYFLKALLVYEKLEDILQKTTIEQVRNSFFLLHYFNCIVFWRWLINYLLGIVHYWCEADSKHDYLQTDRVQLQEYHPVLHGDRVKRSRDIVHGQCWVTFHEALPANFQREGP